ncbi:MAG: glycoside hydrolase family 2 protein [Planctomycetota bacterium]
MGNRLFAQHEQRTTIGCDGPWEVFFPSDGTRIAVRDHCAGVREILDIPGCWEFLPGRRSYRGQAVFRRLVQVPHAGHGRLHFAGISHTATVYWNGKRVGGHHNAFTAFSVDLPRLQPGEHEILVHVSNEHGELSGLHIPNDYYNYGGISRPATLHLLADAVGIDRVEVVPNRRGAGWRAACTVHLGNRSRRERDLRLHLALAGGSIERSVTVPPGGRSLKLQLDPGTVTAWTPAEPQLYWCRARVYDGEACIDDWCDRIGFRTVGVRGSKILLNGEPVFLRGFNRHEDHADFGCAIPESLMRRDLLQMRAMGCNAVRTCHYPNDERFLDLCDELGFLVWEENHARGQNVAAMQHPRFREQCYAVTREMVEQHINRPCIVVWGVMNECASESEVGRAMYAEQFALIEELDPSRPTTYASCRHANDICQDLPRVCYWNLYPRWYFEDDPVHNLEQEVLKRYRKRGMGGKPVIVSETGAGAIPGMRDPVRRAKWSEGRQADILAELCDAFLDHRRLSGLFLWQFCDVRVDEQWARDRPRTMNNKGVVDEYRREKLAVPVVRERFLADAGRRGGAAALPRPDAPLPVLAPDV